MAEKGCTIVVTGILRVGFQSHFQEYSGRIKTLLYQHRAVVIRRQLIEERLYGNQELSLIMLIDFEDKELARSIFFEQDYVSIIPLRDRIFKSFNMYIAASGEV